MVEHIKRQLAAQGISPPKAPSVPPVQRTPGPAPKEPREPGEAGRSEIIDTIPKAAPPTAYHVGPYRLDVANGTHYPGRVRLVIVGPASEDLPAALVAALTEFIKP